MKCHLTQCGRTRTPSIATIVAAAACWCSFSPFAHAYSLREDDKAKLFSKEAVSEAADTIEGLHSRYHKDLRIQTFERVPFFKDPTGRVKKMDDAARERFFAQWAKSKARTTGTDGIYILICKRPLEVQVIVEQRGRARPFTDEDADRLRQEIYKLLQDNRPDEALRVAVAQTESQLEKWFEANGERVLPVKYDWAGLAIVLAAVVGAWLALYFLHGFAEGAFPVGSAAIGPLALGVGGEILTGLRALGTMHGPTNDPPAAHDAHTLIEETPVDRPSDRNGGD